MNLYCSRCLLRITKGTILVHWNEYHLTLLLQYELRRKGIEV